MLPLRMRRTRYGFRILIAAAVVSALGGAQVLSAHAAAGDTTRVSLASDGSQGSGRSASPSISADGRYVAFDSSSTNFPGGAGGYFLRDRQTRTTTLLTSVGDDHVLSADAQVVGFDAFESDVVSGDTNGATDVFVLNRQTGVTTRVSVDSSGAQSDGESTGPVLSANGRFVAFQSAATNLVSNDTNGASDIFLHDVQTGSTELISVASDGTLANAGSNNPSISADGRIVVFSSAATNLVSGDTNGQVDIFARDRQTGTTTRVSVNSSGVEADRGGTDPYVSANGRFVSFSSFAHNLMTQDSLEFQHIYLHDLQTGSTILASAANDGSPLIERAEDSVVSSDGRYVAFQFDDKGDGQAIFYLYERDTQSGTITNLTSGRGSGSWSGQPAITADGSIVVFASDFSNVVSGDTNGQQDIFAHENAALVSNPSVTSITRADSSPASTGPVHFNVTFSEGVTGVDASDFSIFTSGQISAASITNVSGSGSSYVVTVDIGSGDGTLRLDLNDDDSILDSSLAPLGGAGAGNGSFNGGETYTVDHPPRVTSIIRAEQSPTSADTIHFDVVFSEQVSGLSSNDLQLTTTGGITNPAITVIEPQSGSEGSAFRVTVTTGSGAGTIRLDFVDLDDMVDSAGQPVGGTGLGNGNFNGGQTYTITQRAVTLLSQTFRSNGNNDGWLLESSENSDQGGSKNSTAQTINIGDDLQNRQYRAILHFPTYYLPDNALVTQVILMMKRRGLVGTDPFTTHGALAIDIRGSFFGLPGFLGLNGLDITDFQSPSSMDNAGLIQNNPVAGWYWSLLDAASYQYVNLTGVTQLRLRFQIDDDNNLSNDYMTFFSGDDLLLADRPQLFVQYLVPK